ncbi:DUF393 domain-containing protein [Spirulina sp. CS-785/01]|uniref:thiol-disulfide oxidoreductase DCC family protein n=1 Tax=Spirulina sp. CS-785/01 TaxID=3021716 RepID=UPI00232BD712|nr:DUF393 domain-containing protein [Spirulina sp. CS-785/01]MDB9315209.1 DUF393 domain-containing protein [Spirulina sp. CS-785/01]
MQQTPTSPPDWEIKLLYDGECPLCVREVNFLQRRDAGRGSVKFIDISDDSYTPEDNAGIDFAAAMGRIHGILPDGSIVRDLEVFRRVYEILGMGWVYGVTRVPVFGTIADQFYKIWAKLRLKLTGRPDLETIIAQREERLAQSSAARCR